MWIFLITVVAVIGGFATWRSTARMMRMQSGTTANAAAFDQLKPGSTAKIVVEIVEATQTELQGKILERQDETHYKRTNAVAHVSFDGSTPVVMGKPADIQAGGVVHVTGAVTGNGAVRATQIVILTGYVKVS